MEWFEEVYNADWRQRLKIERIVHRERTDHQEVLIFDSAMFGRVLALDGILQTTERDEFIYHEMISHVPMIAHGVVRDVLIIGGGDGGTLEEVLKHASLERATVVEIDPRVVELSRTFLASICKGAFDDPRTRLLFTDGLAFLAATEERFDVIIVDSTDPFGPGEALFDARFYADCRARLRPGGVVVHQGGNPFAEWPRFAAAQRRLGRVFEDASFYWAAVPSYYGGPFVFGWGSNDPAARRLGLDELARRAVPAGLRWYAPAL
ncbi:MAG: polyamine aminopropyltransferase, partial [Geminicoccaceae bacterium]